MSNAVDQRDIAFQVGKYFAIYRRPVVAQSAANRFQVECLGLRLDQLHLANNNACDESACTIHSVWVLFWLAIGTVGSGSGGLKPLIIFAQIIRIPALFGLRQALSGDDRCTPYSRRVVSNTEQVRATP